MLKFLLSIGLVMTSLSGWASDKSSGCGLGWELFKDKTIVSSSLRSTTHAYLPNTFSMTSGTSGCAKHEFVMDTKRGIHFLEVNEHSLAMDAAIGEGEYLGAFAESMGCHWSKLDQFKSVIKNNYGAIFNDPASPAVTLQLVKEYIRPLGCGEHQSA